MRFLGCRAVPFLCLAQHFLSGSTINQQRLIVSLTGNMTPTKILHFLSISVLVVSIFSSDKNHDDTAQTLTADKQSSGTSWIDISDGVQDAGGNPILEPSDRLEWILGDPSLLDLDTGERYVFANEGENSVLCLGVGEIGWREEEDDLEDGKKGDLLTN